MSKPKLKKEVAIILEHECVRTIYIHSTQDAVTEFEEFGCVTQSHYGPNSYQILVDSRYDFDEVLAYVNSYG